MTNEELRAQSVLYMENVFKFYSNKRVLENVDLAIEPGEFVSLVGPSGCGKSTLLRLILGQEFPEDHKSTIFEIDGKMLDFPNVERGIVYQHYSLFPNLTVVENVMSGMVLPSSVSVRRKKKAEFKERAIQYLEYVNLAGEAYKYPGELSGGMRQRVAIAQALITRPKILLMDEPFGALDPGTREDMQVLILELWQKHKMTIMFITHELDEAVFLGTRLVVLSQYYKDDRGADFFRGARIIHDQFLKKEAPSTEWKKTEQFASIVQDIRTNIFKTDYLKHVKRFDLNHPNSFQTLRFKEDNNNGKK